MSAYIISICEINNPGPQMKEYAEKSAAISARYGCRYLVRGKPARVLSGEDLQRKVLIVSEFPSREQAEAFWDSPDYQAIKPLREGTGIYDIGIFDAPPG
ncbi:MAG: DUF1330 domain-containing protein [Chromatiales bacterium]|nr:DUF1330 domain-containing protein [Chromatiales bacterium]